MAAAILITGANRGLGFEFASQYLADGWRVFAACRMAQDTGGMLNVVAMDITDAESVRNATTQLKEVAIDVLINSAGIAGASGQKTGNVDYESWAHVFNVNTMGPCGWLSPFAITLPAVSEIWRSPSRVAWVRSPAIRLAAPLPIATPRRR
jgi:NAD(P)-dependent dehydrogenase (short-subunit alcohol dehydrogenase family)